MDKTVAIVQSNYVPWIGYFDLIGAADEFVLYDEVQFTRRDWRNRNRIRTADGVAWLTIPVESKGRFHQRISDTRTRRATSAPTTRGLASGTSSSRARATTSLSKSAGGAGYVPVQGDYDGDGKTDFVVYNTSSGLGYGMKSSTGYTTTIAVSWGGTGYAPVRGDFDGDGKVDLATYHATSGNRYVLLSGANHTTSISKNWGGSGYAPVPQYP